MSSRQKIKILCHDCSEETIVLISSEQNELDESDSLFCPHCGSENTELEI